MRCETCKEDKEPNEFYARSKRICKKCRNKKNYEARKAAGKATSQIQTPETMRARNLKYNYKITPEQYDELFKQQEGRCAICKELSAKRLHVDHCHDSKRVRGLLCGPCNAGIGFLKHNIRILQEAIAYLQ